MGRRLEKKQAHAARFARQNLGLASTMEPLPATPAGLSSGENLAGNVDNILLLRKIFFFFSGLYSFILFSFAQEDP